MNASISHWFDFQTLPIHIGLVTISDAQSSIERIFKRSMLSVVAVLTSPITNKILKASSSTAALVNRNQPSGNLTLSLCWPFPSLLFMNDSERFFSFLFFFHFKSSIARTSAVVWPYFGLVQVFVFFVMVRFWTGDLLIESQKGMFSWKSNRLVLLFIWRRLMSSLQK